jgi:hypothetical protein
MEKCNIHGCKKPAEFEVILHDVYPYDEFVFFERDFTDFTCLFLGGGQMAGYENHASGTRGPHESLVYPYSKQEGRPGFTNHRPMRDHA